VSLHHSEWAVLNDPGGGISMAALINSLYHPTPHKASCTVAVCIHAANCTPTADIVICVSPSRNAAYCCRYKSSWQSADTGQQGCNHFPPAPGCSFKQPYGRSGCSCRKGGVKHPQRSLSCGRSSSNPAVCTRPSHTAASEATQSLRQHLPAAGNPCRAASSRGR